MTLQFVQWFGLTTETFLLGLLKKEKRIDLFFKSDVLYFLNEIKKFKIKQKHFNEQTKPQTQRKL